ncbi:hypothetical protein DL89DRAFT_211706, partial [Linderina pennispora]
MGLGKTLSIISLVLKLPSQLKRCHRMKFIDDGGSQTQTSSGTLIVCPLSTMANWEEQLALHVLPGNLRVLSYHGSRRVRNPKRLCQYDIVLTTYDTDTQWYQIPETPYVSPLQAVHWHRVVLDEAHTIKERRTATSHSAHALSADRRWCLTGTPIQNR